MGTTKAKTIRKYFAARLKAGLCRQCGRKRHTYAIRCNRCERRRRELARRAYQRAA